MRRKRERHQRGGGIGERAGSEEIGHEEEEKEECNRKYHLKQ